jgi:tetratricopeptide (TPR) repeat protein
LILGDDRSAETDLKRVIGSRYQDPEANMVYGLLLQSRGRLQEALREYDVALSSSDLEASGRCSTQFNRGNIYLMLKSYAEAEQDFDQVIISSSCDETEREDAFVNRANVRSLTGNRAGALADWQEALRLDPNDPVVFKNRGGEYIDDGRFQLALDDYNRYLSLRPDDDEAYIVRSTLYEDLGDPQRARSDRETAQELFRTHRSRSYGPRGLLYPAFARKSP